MKRFFKLLAVVFVATFVLLCSAVNVNAADTLRILIIEINPHLQTVAGKPKISEYFEQDLNAAKNEMLGDINFTSHGMLSAQVVKYEYLDEFPTFKSWISLDNGTKAHRFDEETWLRYTNHTGGYSGWMNLWNNDIDQASDSYMYDYEYIINKFDLINRNKNGEFDQVWLLSTDPMYSYETLMVGREPFWVNGPGYRADCENFEIVNVSISRRDSNLHAFGHGAESIIRSAFSRNYSVGATWNNNGSYKRYWESYYSYNENVVTADKNSFKDLNLVEQFMLNVYANSKSIGSVGNIHFPYNGSSDYDYSNTSKVLTNWREWLNYPNITGNFQYDDNTAWHSYAGNSALGFNEDKSATRLYCRFWFWLMPHIEGYTEDGHLHNWWHYVKTLDFVTKVEADTNEYTDLQVGNALELKYTLTYNSGKTETLVNPNASYDNIHIEGDSVVKMGDRLVAYALGESTVKVYHDGQFTEIKYNVNIEGETPTEDDFCASTVGDDPTSRAMERFENVNCKVKATTDLNSSIGNILNIAYGLIGAIALIMVIIGGIHYTTSKGDPEKTKKAKQTITYGLVGLAIVIAAFATTYFVLKALQ